MGEGVTFVAQRLRECGLIEGERVSVILDTGADISVIDRSLVEKLMEREKEKEIQGVPDGLVVRDASGEKMTFSGRVVLSVTVRGATSPVGFHIGRRDDVLLGMNALEALGIQWNIGRERETEEVAEKPQGETSHEATRDATVIERVWVRAGEKREMRVSGPKSVECVLWTSKNGVLAGVYGIDESGEAKVVVRNGSESD